MNYDIVKNAGALEDALKEMAEKAQFQKHPFETIFSTALPMLLFSRFKLFSILLFYLIS